MTDSGSDDETGDALRGVLAELARVEPAAPTAKPGDLYGRYRLSAELGRGGFGVVFAAEDSELGRTVAVKLMRSRADGDGKLAEQFYREASLVARLRHPTIVTVYDWGRQGETPFLVLELLHGETLEARLAKGRLDLEAAIRLALPLAEGLAHAHGLLVLHRDLKPGNIFLCEDGSAKILDFGLAQAADGASLLGGAGTPRYMAPEQRARKAASARSDVYSFGLVLLEMVTSRDDQPIDEGVVARAPAPLQSLLKRCLHADEAQRFADGAALLVALRELAFALFDEPLRRRRRRLGAAAVVVAVSAIAAAVGTRFESARHARSAARVSAEVRRVESELRFARLTPPHPMRADETRAQESLDALSRSLIGLGAFEQQLAEYAIGRGYLALDRPGEAVEHLRRAAATSGRGAADDEIAEALGEALGRLWQAQQASLDGIDDPLLRRDEAARLDRELREPAVALLRRRPTAHALTLARLALWDRRFDDSVRLSEAAAATDPWLYEAHLVASAAYRERGRLAYYERGDTAAARIDLDRAAAASARAIAIGRSDPATYDEACTLGAQRLILNLDSKEVPEVGATADAACDQSRALAPHRMASLNEQVQLLLSWMQRVHGVSAERQRLVAKALGAVADARALDRTAREPLEASVRIASTVAVKMFTLGDDPSAVVERGLAEGEELLRRSPGERERTWIAQLEVVKMRTQVDRGIDPSAGGKRVDALLDSARAPHGLSIRGDAAQLLSEWAVAHEGDPNAAWQRATASFEEALRLEPNEPQILDSLGNIYYGQGAYARDHGQDGAPAFRRAAEASEKVLRLLPDRPSILANYGNTLTDYALNELDYGREALPLIERSVQLLERSARLEPRGINTWFNLALAERAHALILDEKKLDPQKAFGAARAAAERAIALAPSDVALSEALADVVRFEGRWHAKHGQSPLTAYRQAEAILDRLCAADPKNAHFARAAVEVMVWRAQWELAHGGAARATVDAAATRYANNHEQGANADWLRIQLAVLQAGQARSASERRRLAAVAEGLLATQPPAASARPEQSEARRRVAALLASPN